MGCRIRQFFSWLLLLGAIVLGVLLGLGVLNPGNAAAAIRQLEESPGQVVYQSRYRLEDQQGHSWQAIAFKRVRPDGTATIALRLVGFPGVVTLDRTQPLKVTDSLGHTLEAAEASQDIFTEGNQPEANVGQYNLQPVLPQLQAELPLKLTLPTIDREAVWLSVPPWLVQEWKSLVTHNV